MLQDYGLSNSPLIRGKGHAAPAGRTFDVQNRVTKERRRVAADSAQEACESCGWMIGDCYRREVCSG